MSSDQMRKACDIMDLTEEVNPVVESEEDDDDSEPIFIRNIPSFLGATNATMYHSEGSEHFDKRNGNVNITIDPKRPKKFFIAVKLLLKDMRTSINRYTHIIHWEIMQYVLRKIFEEQLAQVLQGVEDRMKSRDLFELYREYYPQDGDDDFIDQVFHDTWEGKYNDREEEVSEDIPQETECIKQKHENPKNVFTISDDDDDVPIKMWSKLDIRHLPDVLDDSGASEYPSDSTASNTQVNAEADVMDTNLELDMKSNY